jgi:hypothetical protein
VDQFVLRAPPFAFDPIPLVGGRMLDQVRKIMPDYNPRSILLGEQWQMEAGISLASWPSMLGWNLAQFGYVGAVLFMAALGWFYARTARHYLIYFDAGSAILNFAIFGMLSMSFNSFGGDIPHTVAFAAGLYLLVSSPRLVQARRVRGINKTTPDGDEAVEGRAVAPKPGTGRTNRPEERQSQPDGAGRGSFPHGLHGVPPDGKS